MKKLLPAILLLFCAPGFAANNTPKNYATTAELQSLTQNLQKVLSTNNMRQHQAMTGAINKIQRNTQQQINLLEKQIQQLSNQTSKAVNAINAQLGKLSKKKG